jgi:hypothetical protein
MDSMELDENLEINSFSKPDDKKTSEQSIKIWQNSIGISLPNSN